MKRLNASVMTVAVVLVLIAFVAPSSAYSIEPDDVKCESGVTTWTFRVTCDGPSASDPGDPHAISHFNVAWCKQSAVTGVLVNNTDLTAYFGGDVDPGWDYGDFDGVHGIKINYPIVEGTDVEVEITLNGCYGDPQMVKWVIKANTLYRRGEVRGPVASNCNTEIPEFSTIAIPIASILGLLFFFNHRKRREEE